MAKLNLSMMQRLNLDALLSVQRGTVDELFTFHDIREKIKLPRGLRGEYVKHLADGRILVDEQAVELAESAEFDFEKEEVRRLQKLLKEWANFSEGDLAWVIPLRKQIEAPA
jgi:hypothetical protein